MEIKTDKYTKTILTIIAVTLVLLLFKPQVQQSLTPPSANALTQMEGVVDSSVAIGHTCCRGVPQ